MPKTWEEPRAFDHIPWYTDEEDEQEDDSWQDLHYELREGK